MTTKITKTTKEKFLKEKLSTDANWAKRALLRIFDFQTNEEKNVEYVKVINGIGFTAFDAEILTSFAKQLNKTGRLSDLQMKVLKSKMPKYWNQVLMISDTEKLESLIINSLN